MLNLLASNTIIAVGNKLLVEAVDGVPPYVYSLVAGGDGGSITATGEYQAPLVNNKGFQDILVTDDNSDTATITISILNHLQLVAEIIQKQLSLDGDQVYIYNQKITVPKDNKMYVAIGVSNMKVIASNMKVIDGVELSYTNSQANLKIDIMSRALEAFNRKEEVVSSLRSVLAQRTQTANMFKIAEVPNSFNDLSGIDGSAIPYRYNVSVNMIYSLRTTKDVDYYDGETALVTPSELNNDGTILDSSEARA